MNTLFKLLFGFILITPIVSCTPEKVNETLEEQSVDPPPSEEEEEELDPNS